MIMQDINIKGLFGILDRAESAIQGFSLHINGHRRLDRAPVINHGSLRSHGFDRATLDRIENCLAGAGSLRLAFTPWIIGPDFCREVLKLSRKQIDNPAFDLLRHLGFTANDIAAANSYCFGHSSMKGAKNLRTSHAAVFVCQDELSPEASIRMAAAVQGFISGDISLSIKLSDKTGSAKAEALLLAAWRQGLKTLTLSSEPRDTASIKSTKAPRRHLATALLQAQKPKMSGLKSAVKKAPRHLMGMVRSGPRSSGQRKDKTAS